MKQLLFLQVARLILLFQLQVLLQIPNDVVVVGDVIVTTTTSTGVDSSVGDADAVRTVTTPTSSSILTGVDDCDEYEQNEENIVDPVTITKKCTSSCKDTRLPPSQTPKATTYHMVGVSGGLQDGFPDHYKLHYYDSDSRNINQNQNQNNKEHNILTEEPMPVASKAIYVGRALVRGYKAYLDLMEPAYRQYTPEPNRPSINPNVFPTGCYNHANIYWIYLIDSRQLINTLAYEPRFLSITPDTGLVELESNETSAIVSKLAHQLLVLQKEKLQQQQQQQNYTTITSTISATINASHVAIPLVTGVWYNPNSHIPSPPIRITVDKYGRTTEVTNYPESLALWASVNDSDRTALADAGCYYLSKNCHSSSVSSTSTLEQVAPPISCPMDVYAAMKVREQRYWDGIQTAIRSGEQDRIRMKQNENRNKKDTWIKRILSGSNYKMRTITSQNNNPYTYICKHGTVRFGSHDASIQINFPIPSSTLNSAISMLGHKLVEDENNTSTGNLVIVPATTATATATGEEVSIGAVSSLPISKRQQQQQQQHAKNEL